MVTAAPMRAWKRIPQQQHRYEALVERFVVTPMAREGDALRFGVMLDGVACSSLVRWHEGACKNGAPLYRWVCDSCQHPARTKSQQYRHLMREHLSCVYLSLDAPVSETVRVREVRVASVRERHVALAGREPIGIVYSFQHPAQSYWRCETCRLICVEKGEMITHLRIHTTLPWPIELVFDRQRPAGHPLIPFTPEQLPVKRERRSDEGEPSAYIDLVQTRIRYLVLSDDTLLGSLHLVTNGPHSAWKCDTCRASFSTSSAIIAHLQYAHQTRPQPLSLYPCFIG